MFKIALIGRPNVGKSTIFNLMSKSSKSIASDIPGVTRDVNESVISIGGYSCCFSDTAGLTARLPGDSSDLQKQIEQNTLDHLSSVDLVLLTVDGKHGLLQEDRELLDTVRKANKQVILLVNKCEKSPYYS